MLARPCRKRAKGCVEGVVSANQYGVCRSILPPLQRDREVVRGLRGGKGEGRRVVALELGVEFERKYHAKPSHFLLRGGGEERNTFFFGIFGFTSDPKKGHFQPESFLHRKLIIQIRKCRAIHLKYVSPTFK